ncbi:hypothetical protein ABZ027_01975 [Streptomyces sp. NPDC006332]|uniref:hypothetical protein n=1 Tax=Streptomyces sp. NPDC006332 TaxID=3155456 RepID=UPI0033A4C6F7
MSKSNHFSVMSALAGMSHLGRPDPQDARTGRSVNSLVGDEKGSKTCLVDSMCAAEKAPMTEMALKRS